MKRTDRRESLVTIAAVLVSPGVLFGCGKQAPTCVNTSALTADELTLRTTTLAYVDTTDLQKLCSGCQLFKPAGENQCGTCVLIKGPINPGGSCKSWVKKA